jgi:hypothetical protein
MKIPFLGGAYESRSPNISIQECENLYLEPPPSQETHEGALVSVPGAWNWLSATDADASPQLTDDDSNPVRGSFVYDDNRVQGQGGRRLFFVIKNVFYEYDGVHLVQRGSNLTTTSGQVSMAANNQGQLMLVDGAKGYVLERQTLTEITDSNFIEIGGPDTVVHQDGYFVVNRPGTNEFHFSDIDNGLSWNGLSFQLAEGSADNVVSILSDRRELWVFGDRTTEVYYNQDDPDIPFQRFQGGYVESGLAARFTPVKFDNSVVWLAKNDRGHAVVVRSGQNWTPTVISTPEVNFQIQQYGRVDDAFAYAYQMEGHEFYVLTFPSAQQTWVYDALTQHWHKRSFTDQTSGDQLRDRYSTHVFYNGMHLMGDYQNGRIYRLDSSIGYVEKDGAGTKTYIQRKRTSPAIRADNESRIRCAAFQLDMEEGNTPSSDVWLSYSKDSGHTWSSEHPRSAGATGEYSHRIIWRKLGIARNWVFRVRTWSDGRVIIKGAFARGHGESLLPSKLER